MQLETDMVPGDVLYKSVGQNFVLAFDDSGGIERLVDYDGTAFPGDHPIAVLTGFYLQEEVEGSFNDEWNSLRRQIQSELRCTLLPPIHMRLMWGKTVKRRLSRGRDNPYVESSFDQIQSWVAKAWSIVDRFVKRRQAGWFWRMLDRTIVTDSHLRYFADPPFQRERLLFKRRAGRLYKEYHRIITSPLLHLYTDALMFANELISTQGPDARIDIRVDAFSDSHGLDVLETASTMKAVARLGGIGRVDRIADGEEMPVVQAADLVGFCNFRNEMARLGHIQPDIALARIVNRRIGQTISSANIQHRLNRRNRVEYRSQSMTMHYAIARAHVANRNARFAARALVPIDVFHARAEEGIASQRTGVSVFTREFLEENAEDPELTSGAP